MKKIVFITGSSSGFGAACARLFAANGYNLILNGRRRQKLEALYTEVKEAFGTDCLLLPFDVQDQEKVFESIATIPAEWQAIDVLINNAGLALGRDLFDEALLSDWNTMIDTNVKGVLYVSKAVLPYMIKRKRGHIINVGSIAGKEVYERGNVYCASKHAVDALTKAMRIDLLQHAIKVTAVHPGAAETEFSVVRFKGAEETAKKVYEGYTPLTAEDVANVIYYTTTLPLHVCINDLVITATDQASSVYLNKKS